MGRALLLVLIAAASTAVAQQGQSQSKETVSPEVAAALKKVDAFFKDNDIKLWPQVLRIAGVEQEMRAPPARYAALMPTDAAVSSFLRDMGLSMDSLAARPQLAKQLIAQHLVLALPPDTQQALVEGKIATVPTLATDRSSGGGAGLTILQAAMKGGSSSGSSGSKLHITDGQGQTAVAVKVVRQDPNKVVLIIDRVLMSGSYYPNFATLCKLRAAQAGPMCTALTQSGVLKDPQQPTFANTVFVPGPKAFQAAGIQLSGTGSSSSSSSSSLSKQQLTELVQYHVVPGLHAFPDGFKDGGSYSTVLPGASLGIAFSGSLDQAARAENATLVAYVIPVDKQRVPVAVYNIFVGQGIVQGIPAVLLPPGFKAPQAASATPPGSTAAEKGRPAGSTGSTGSQGRRLLGSGIDSVPVTVLPFNAAETQIRAQTRSMFKDAEDRWS